MKRKMLLCLALAAALLAGCRQTPVPPPEEIPPEEEQTGVPEVPAEDEHAPASQPQMLEGCGEGGYCGNTVTTVTADGEAFSFWGSDSVELTDLLLYLDYSGDVCRCLPEYTVDTEFGDGYGVNLTGFYVRHEDGQASLTEKQAEMIREIMDRNRQEPDSEGTSHWPQNYRDSAPDPAALRMP